MVCSPIISNLNIDFQLEWLNMGQNVLLPSALKHKRARCHAGWVMCRKPCNAMS
jgi:hypothetical protein